MELLSSKYGANDLCTWSSALHAVVKRGVSRVSRHLAADRLAVHFVPVSHTSAKPLCFFLFDSAKANHLILQRCSNAITWFCINCHAFAINPLLESSSCMQHDARNILYRTYAHHLTYSRTVRTTVCRDYRQILRALQNADGTELLLASCSLQQLSLSIHCPGSP